MRVRVFSPATIEVSLPDIDAVLTRLGETDLFEFRGNAGGLPARYRVRRILDNGQVTEQIDPYCFPPQLAEADIAAFGAGQHWHAWWLFGAHQISVDGIAGSRFAVWAPEAERVSVVGDFNAWDGRRHPYALRGGPRASGNCSCPGLRQGSVYKYEIRNRWSGELLLKTDPYAQADRTAAGHRC